MRKGRNRENEKGAAMVMVLLLSTLLLVASGGLLLEASMNTANVTDSTAEQQAYNAAESGLQSAINVLRGNVVLADGDRYDTSKPATDPANRINFRKAVLAAKSNDPSDTSGVARLSRWMDYENTANGNRVKLNSDAYTFDLNVTDPDNTGNIISFNTVGRMYDPTTGANPRWKSSLTFGTLPNRTTVTFTPKSVNNLDVSSGLANTDFGTFQVTTEGAGANIPEDITFQIVVNVIAPYKFTPVLRGVIKGGTGTTGSNVLFDFDSQNIQKVGSTITLEHDTFQIPATGTPTAITGSITQVEPYRVVVRATGYGPRGAKKILEATVQKNFFNGMEAPATLTLVGSSTGFLFEAGDSQNVTYSGDDVVTNVLIPPIGTTNDTNLAAVFNNLETRARKADIIGNPTNVDVEMPFWLQSPTNLDGTVRELKAVAQASGRYYTSGQTPDGFGNNSTATGITFVDGDVSLNGDGGGILVCTGKLTLRGAFNFKGLIVVTGNGGVDRSGGGNGVLQGNVVIAPYNPNNLNAGFLGPKYDISGGGTSTITYNSSSVANGMTAVSNFVLGVAEK